MAQNPSAQRFIFAFGSKFIVNQINEIDERTVVKEDEGD